MSPFSGLYATWNWELTPVTELRRFPANTVKKRLYFDPAVHVVDRFTIPADWPRIRAVDFGFRDPTCVLWLALSPGGTVYVYRQLFATLRLLEDIGREILELSSGESILATICDHGCAERGTLERLGIRTAPASKSILVGIQLIQSLLRPGADGKPRLRILRGSLVRRDSGLVAAKKPASLEEEFASYEWAIPKDGSILKEIPRDLHNHGMDALRYGCMALRRVQAVSALPPGRIAVHIPKALHPRRGQGVRTGWGDVRNWDALTRRDRQIV